MGNKVNDNKFLVQQQLLNNVIIPVVKQQLDGTKKVSSYPAIIHNVYSDSSIADVIVEFGDTSTILEKIPNKTNIILRLGDVIELYAPNGDLTNCYIKTSYSKIQTIDAQFIRGVLTVGGDDNVQGEIIIKDGNKQSMNISGHVLGIYDWVETGLQSGQLYSGRLVDSSGGATGTPVISLASQYGCYLDLGCQFPQNSNQFFPAIRIDDGVSDTSKVKTNIYSHETTIFPQGGNNQVNFNVSTNGYNIYGDSSYNLYDINNVGSLRCQSLNVVGSKNCVQSTQNYGDRLFYSYELADNWLGDTGWFKINEGECVVAIDSIIRECIDVNNSEYIIKLYPNENCNWKITEKTALYFVVIADKDIEFAYEISAKRKGFENERLEYINNLKNNLTQPQEINPLLDELHDENLDMINKSLFENMKTDNTLNIS